MKNKNWACLGPPAVIAVSLMCFAFALAAPPPTSSADTGQIAIVNASPPASAVVDIGQVAYTRIVAIEIGGNRNNTANVNVAIAAPNPNTAVLDTSPLATASTTTSPQMMTAGFQNVNVSPNCAMNPVANNEGDCLGAELATAASQNGIGANALALKGPANEGGVGFGTELATVAPITANLNPGTGSTS